MARTCSRCGVESELDNAFTVRNRSFSKTTLTLCPRCNDEFGAREHRAAVVLVLVLVGIGVALNAARGWLVGVNCALVVVFLAITIPVHECTHALTAKLLGLRVFRMVFGAGRTLFTFTLGLPVEVRAIPLWGLVLVGHKTKRFLRLRTLVVTLAGPLSNGTMLALALAFVPLAEIVDGFDERMMPVGAFAAANAFMLFMNLLPMKTQTSFGSVPSDGLAMLAAPFMSAQQIDGALMVRYALEAAAASEAHDYVSVRRWFEKGLALFPDAPILRYNIALAHFHLDDFAESRRVFLRLLETPDLDPVLKALVQSNIAASDVRLDDPELLGEADRMSAEAFGAIPWVPVVRGTRGSVLVEMGSLEEGLGLLRQAVELSEDAKVAAIFACWIAIGEGRRGDHDEARRYLDVARTADASCAALPRAEREVHAALLTPR